MPCSDDTYNVLYSLTPECHNVTKFIMYSMANQLNGIRVPHIRSSELCQEYCLNDTSCAAIDFHLQEQSCWSHSSTSEDSHMEGFCCNHYKKTVACECESSDDYVGCHVNGNTLIMYHLALKNSVMVM